MTNNYEQVTDAMTDFQDTLTNWLQYLETRRSRSPATIAEYRRDLLAFFRHLPSLQAEHGPGNTLSDVAPAHLSAYLAHLEHQHDLAAFTLGRKIASLRGFFAFAHRTCAIPSDPAAELVAPVIQKRSPKSLSEPRSERLLAH